ncbi:MAG TPA: quinone-interacting membrane-bound oxidoreductase complex subunit QmoC [Desulfomicrobiaceae bacterium]|nr:quinone-interacting membrane-bound oxidoreductase complex subunit QmoC [Desulfomicrobiaceae bacterium]
MSKATRIEPDLQFIKELQEVGGADLKKCYQCATCSVACPLSPADNPYPRKEMVWAQWGLKDKLVSDIDIWLCHNCGTCSDLCPRGAKPGDLLAALRNMAYRNLVKPTAIGKWMSSAAYLPILVGIPAVIIGIIWMIRAAMLGTFFPVVDGEIVYGNLFPGDFTIDPLFGLTAVFVAISFGVGIKNLLDGFKKSVTPTFVVGYKKPSLKDAVVATLKDEILTHKKWKDCGEEPGDEEKFKGHLTLFYGFVACFIVTSIVAVSHWGGKLFHFIAPLGHTPMPLWSPVKILANIGAVLLLVGLTYLTRRRLNQDPDKSTSSYYDWYLLGVIWVVTLTGILSEIFRLAGVAPLAFTTYYVHLISVFMLIAYLPWSKLGHLVYRTTALIYARYVGRLPIEENLIEDDKILVI